MWPLLRAMEVAEDGATTQHRVLSIFRTHHHMNRAWRSFHGPPAQLLLRLALGDIGLKLRLLGDYHYHSWKLLSGYVVSDSHL